MTRNSWKRFTWDLSRLEVDHPAIESRYTIREAEAPDETGVRNLILSAFTLDSDWNYILSDIREPLEESLERAFPPRRDAALHSLVITHGARIVGASILTTHPDAVSHLLTGPCIPMEYRNRGLATALLAESLRALKAAGLSTAYGITLGNVPTAEFVYPKFGSTEEPYKWTKRVLPT